MGSEVVYTDVLIIGNGIAGLRAACSAGETGASVTVFGLGEGASPGIMAFNAPVGLEDSPEIFFEETLSCGCYINDRVLARVFSEDIVQEVSYLENIGLKFDRNRGSTDCAFGPSPRALRSNWVCG
jgi:succinate dehydrogenase/fumarate reductase flavoprotein subunit